MDWARDLRGWSHPEWSRQVLSRPHRWHVQETGEGPLLLWLHGAGATTHSWRDLWPQLPGFRHVGVDLPGHGFTRLGTRLRSGLLPMSEDIAALCASQGWQPVAVIGHSAGAALALQLADKVKAPDGGPVRIVGLNASLTPFEGVAGWLFPVMAKVLALNPLTAWSFSLGSNKSATARRVIEATGSHLSDAGYGYYARLLSDRTHIDGVLTMMSQWSHDALLRDLPTIPARALLLTGAEDAAVPPRTSKDAAAAMPDAVWCDLDGLGHLAHEEDPARVAAVISEFLADVGDTSA